MNCNTSGEAQGNQPSVRGDGYFGGLETVSGKAKYYLKQFLGTQPYRLDSRNPSRI
jgi:hypothetical protein